MSLSRRQAIQKETSDEEELARKTEADKQKHRWNPDQTPPTTETPPQKQPGSKRQETMRFVVKKRAEENENGGTATVKRLDPVATLRNKTILEQKPGLFQRIKDKLSQ